MGFTNSEDLSREAWALWKRIEARNARLSQGLATSIARSRGRKLPATLSDAGAPRRGTIPGVGHYLFNLVKEDAANGPALRELAAGFLAVGMWGIDADEAHGDAVASGDQILIYLSAPERVFIGRAELASAVHDWTPSEAQAYPGHSPRGVLLAQVEEWDPPVSMQTVLSRIDPSEKAKADFQAGVVRITANEYETALAVATGR
jgi:hypothetical protein